MNNAIVIDKINGDVAFNEELHLYWNTRNKDIKYTSVTTLIQNYYEKFDEEFWSSYKAIERIVGVDVFKSMSIKGMLLDVKEWKDSYLDLIDIDKDLFFHRSHHFAIFSTYEYGKRPVQYRLPHRLLFGFRTGWPPSGS